MSVRRPNRLLVKTAAILLMGSVVSVPAPQTQAQAVPAAQRSPLEEPDPQFLVTLVVPTRDLVDRLVDAGYDLAEHVEASENGFLLEAVLTSKEMADLEALGVRVYEWGDLAAVEARWHALLDERQATLERNAQIMAEVDSVSVIRADYIIHQGLPFLSVEAKTSAGSSAGVTLVATWDAGPGTEPDSGGMATMSRFVDAGAYMYHRLLVPVKAGRPSTVTVTSSLGGQASAFVSDWLTDVKSPNPHYAKDFIDHYMTPSEVYERIEALAAEFPDLAEIIELPYKTNGYRRKAQATVGSSPNAAVVVTSVAWGHEGGNDITVAFVPAPEPDAHLSVEVDGSAITVLLATDGNGNATSTAAEVVAALNAYASDLVSATTYRGNAGAGIVAPTGPVNLQDFLNAPADEVTREPFTVRAIRIGKHRDGSKTGVLAYAQEHAREWVTPLVAVETAERLLRNYAHHGETKQLVDNLDIFIIPSVNPDGGHYSFYDFNMQRRNMTNYCGPEASDPGYRTQWGVDVNRNYGVGSLFDGYSGGSSSCLSDTFAGPAELSEPESRNVIWLAENYPNIKFALNIHSHGGYFMWAPGAYRSAGRVTLPRPDLRDEAYFWQMAEQILSEIRDHRGVSVLPGRTGATADVLYSAAGNSADHLWYDLGIYAINFEVGAQLWEDDRWVSVGFQPPFEEGHEEAMEYANGLIALLKVARDCGKDHKRPKSELVPGKGTFDGPEEVRFVSDEPATIYYTTDGSRPTFQSARVRSSGVREGGETLLVTETTTFKWFAVDVAGNVEGNYNPNGKGENYNQATIVIRP